MEPPLELMLTPNTSTGTMPGHSKWGSQSMRSAEAAHSAPKSDASCCAQAPCQGTPGWTRTACAAWKSLPLLPSNC